MVSDVTFWSSPCFQARQHHSVQVTCWEVFPMPRRLYNWVNGPNDVALQIIVFHFGNDVQNRIYLDDFWVC